MPRLKQMNTLVEDDLVKLVNKLHKKHGWSSKGQVVTTAVEALAELMDRHEATAARAAEADVGELFRKLARVMPAGLTDAKVEWGRLSDGRPALIYNGEWTIAEDYNGDLMVVRRDGDQIGHIAHGRIEVLADDRDLAISEIAALN